MIYVGIGILFIIWSILIYSRGVNSGIAFQELKMEAILGSVVMFSIKDLDSQNEKLIHKRMMYIEEEKDS